jgi:hypothetical protein
MSQANDTKSTNQGRRQFLGLAGAAAGVVVLASVLPRHARAADLPHVTLDDPTATALNYTEDASKVDKAKATNYVAGSSCANCNFYQGGASGYGPCQLFPGKAVNAKGWCSGYAKKA